MGENPPILHPAVNQTIQLLTYKVPQHPCVSSCALPAPDECGKPGSTQAGHTSNTWDACASVDVCSGYIS